MGIVSPVKTADDAKELSICGLAVLKYLELQPAAVNMRALEERFHDELASLKAGLAELEIFGYINTFVFLEWEEEPKEGKTND